MTIGRRGIHTHTFGPNNFSSGLNSYLDGLSIGRNEVQVAKNCKLYDGIRYRPGSEALDYNPWTNSIELFDIYAEINGTDNLIVISDNKLYDVDKDDGSRTLRYTFGSAASNCELSNYLDKAWISTNGEAVKIENNLSVYPIGIDKPSTGVASAVAGGALPDGTYRVYISYARRVSGVNVLYSGGSDLGDVVLGSGNNTIQITSFGNSSDAQVGNKIVWLTEPLGTTTYFYHETTDNTTETINISSATQKNINLIYDVISEPITDVPEFEHIIAFNNRIYGSVGKRIYYSLQNDNNVYDMERFLVSSYRDVPYNCEGFFVLNNNLYINTNRGIIAFPGGNVETIFEYLSKESFVNINCIVEHSNNVFGLTRSRGIGIFDGVKFSEYIVSRNIVNEINMIYTTCDAYRPFAELVPTDGRIEMHLSYFDNNISGGVTHNARIVLNLTDFQIFNNTRVNAPFWYWTNGATWIKNINNVLYNAQSITGGSSIIYKETPTLIYDNGIYLQDGTLGDSTKTVDLQVDTRIIMPSVDAIIDIYEVRAVLLANKETKISIIISENEGLFDQRNFKNDNVVAIYDQSHYDDGSVYGSTRVSQVRRKLKKSLKGRSYYVRVTHDANDPSFYMQSINIKGKYKTTRST